MDEAVIEIGISRATLSRMENEWFPDTVTFARILTWLGNEPNKYFE